MKCLPVFLIAISGVFSQNSIDVMKFHISDVNTVRWGMKNIDVIQKDSVKTKEKKAVLYSLAIPGAGQWIKGDPWWKSALFLTIETLGIYGTIKWDKSSEDIRRKFEMFADEHWELETWYKQTQKIFPENWDKVLIGTHKLTVLIDGNYYYSDQILNLAKDYSWRDMQVIRDRDFYENIGKYDQFVGGWDDPYDNPFDDLGNWYTIKKGNSDEEIILTKQKDIYREWRHDSNTDKKWARYAITAVLFNHVVSALEANWSQHNSSSKLSEFSIRIDVNRNSLNSMGAGGVRMVFEW